MNHRDEQPGRPEPSDAEGEDARGEARPAERADEPRGGQGEEAPRDATLREGHEGVPGPAITWEQDLDIYPLRKPEDDPRWAMWVFWIWVILCSSLIMFMVVLTTLGWFYD